MIRTFCFPILLIGISVNSFSQGQTQDFKIAMPEQKVENSLYNKISYLDSRYDITNMGIIQLGAFNRKVKVVPEVAFEEQLYHILKALTDEKAKEGELLFQLRQFNFAEITGAMSEKGYCYLRANLYERANDSYKKIDAIDTVILVKSLDVTKKMMKKGSELITDFIASNLTKTGNDTISYSLADVQNIDNMEKRSLKLYTTATFSNGLYTTYESFRDQLPDKQPAEVEEKNGTIANVKVVNEKGKFEKVSPKDIYAIVHNGNPFIATDYGYYPLQKTDDKFLFTGKAKTTASAGDVIAASFFFGIIGGLIASNAESKFEMMIDHTNGGFVRLREVKGN